MERNMPSSKGRRVRFAQQPNIANSEGPDSPPKAKKSPRQNSNLTKAGKGSREPPRLRSTPPLDEAIRRPHSAEGHVTGMLSRMTYLINDLSNVRQETRQLYSDYASLEEKFNSLKPIMEEIDQKSAETHQNLDEVIYLNKLIKHLNIVEKKMTLVPCVVGRTGNTRNSVHSSHSDRVLTGSQMCCERKPEAEENGELGTDV